MAKYGVMLLGGLLILGGFASAWTGMEIVQIERGWTQVIAGVTALTGGVVTLAIGQLIGAVENLRDAQGVRRSYASRTGRLEVSAPAAEPEAIVAAPVAAVVATIPAPLAPVLQAAPEPDSPAPAAKEQPPASAPVIAKDAPRGSDNLLADTGEHDPALEWLRSAPRATSGLNLSGMKKSALDAGPASTRLEGLRNRPAELRRYEANGVQYTLYADGSIDSNSPEGLLHFANMDELKAHLSKDEAREASATKVPSAS